MERGHILIVAGIATALDPLDGGKSVLIDRDEESEAPVRACRRIGRALREALVDTGSFGARFAANTTRNRAVWNVVKRVISS